MIRLLFALLASLSALVAFAPCPVFSQSTDLATNLKNAKAGDVIKLPPGEHKLGDLVVPAGVTLQGAGYKTTILDAAGHANGIIVRAAKAQVRDLTIRGAIENAVIIDGAKDVEFSRVVAANSVNGVLVRNS